MMTLGQKIRHFRERAGLSQLNLEVENGKPFGAIVYVKKYEDDFRYEREMLGVVSKQIAVAIQNAKKFEALSSPLSRGD